MPPNEKRQGQWQGSSCVIRIDRPKYCGNIQNDVNEQYTELVLFFLFRLVATCSVRSIVYH